MGTGVPWQVGEWELGQDLAKIEEQWVSIEEILRDAARFDRRVPDVSAWSAGQHAGHAILVAETIADRIEGNLAEPDRNREQVAPELALRVLAGGRFTRGSATAPAEVNPEAKGREEFLALLPTAIASWRAIQAGAEQLPACEARFPHFRLGYFSSVEWVRMCVVHTAHHLAIVRDITA
jgi:hypothetical protein